jgi:dihydroxy-acid dehydratase
MRDLAEVGGVPLIMKALLDGGYLHGGCVTVTGRTIAENLADTPGTPARTSSARPSNPITRMGGVVGLKGSLAPEGAMVKVAGLASLKFRGPARVFDTEEACMEAVQARRYEEGDVLVIRYEGPKGGPGMREMLG